MMKNGHFNEMMIFEDFFNFVEFNQQKGAQRQGK